jgi:hypothetical protein
MKNIKINNNGGKVKYEIKMKSGKVEKKIIEEKRDGKVSVKYEKREEGMNEM